MQTKTKALLALFLLLFAIPSGAVDKPADASNLIRQFIFVSGGRSDGTGVISVFRIGKDGSLSSMNTTSYILPEYADLLAPDPSGRFLFAVTNSWLLTFTVNPGTGRLFASAATPLPPNVNRTGIVVDPVAPFLFLSNDLNPPAPGNEYPFGPPQVTTYRIHPNGRLSLLGSTEIPGMAASIRDGLSIDHDGKVLALNTINSNGVFSTTALKVNSSTGNVTFLNTLSEPDQDYTRQLLVDPSASHFYQPLAFLFEAPGGASVAVYTVDASIGVLEKVQVQTCGCDPGSIVEPFSFGFNAAMSPDGKFLFQTTDVGLVVYVVDQLTGFVAPITSSLITALPSTDESWLVAVDATGHYVYFTDNGLRGVMVSETGATSLIPGGTQPLPEGTINTAMTVLTVRRP